MANFGLDNVQVKKLKNELDVESVRIDQPSDFFFLPQFDAIYLRCSEELLKRAAERLNNSSYAPMPPIDMEVPKSARISARTVQISTPNYFRPGSVLFPEDRVIYHFLGQEASEVIEKSIDRNRVLSNRPLKKKGSGFSPASIQWDTLKEEFENEIKSGKFSLVLRCDISQYFSSINQHELVNQLEHQGLDQSLARFLEKFLAGLTLDRSSRGIIQGVYGSDVIGNGYLIAIDEFISDQGHPHFRYVDDIYVLFETADEFRAFFPNFVKQLRDYDLGLNEFKSFVAQPIKLLHEETELDKAIEAAKEEAIEMLTDYEEVEIETGPYGQTATELLENEPDDEEVELEATRFIFENLDDFKGNYILGVTAKLVYKMSMTFDLTNPIYSDADKAREHLESLHWPNGPICPHCGETKRVTRLQGASTRPGVVMCNSCRKPFTVTVGTVFEGSKIPLNKWLLAFRLMASSKKGVSAHQLHRSLGITYKSAWFMAHRIREAMDGADGHDPLGGGPDSVVEADETYVGGKSKNRAYRKPAPKKVVVALVERDGRARSFHVANVNAKHLRSLIVTNVHRGAHLMTDEATVYTSLGREFNGHSVVNHSAKEYVTTGGFKHSNTAENFFSVFKRGLIGTYHHMSEAHLGRYCREFDFRYNTRDLNDAERTDAALVGAIGRRLTYRRTDAIAA